MIRVIGTLILGFIIFFGGVFLIETNDYVLWNITTKEEFTGFALFTQLWFFSIPILAAVFTVVTPIVIAFYLWATRKDSNYKLSDLQYKAKRLQEQNRDLMYKVNSFDLKKQEIESKAIEEAVKEYKEKIEEQDKEIERLTNAHETQGNYLVEYQKRYHKQMKKISGMEVRMSRLSMALKRAKKSKQESSNGHNGGRQSQAPELFQQNLNS